jgi:hypothetical protein
MHATPPPPPPLPPRQPQDLFKSQLQAQMVVKPTSAPAAATAAGGAGSAAAAAPAAPAYKGVGDCAATIIRQRGIAGIFQGLQATVARNIVGVSAYFYFYEAFRALQAKGRPVDTLSPLQVLLAGGMGG